MRFIIVTGMSGAGKSTVLRFLEDMGFFCVDNMPPGLIPKFIDLCRVPSNEIENVALGIDIRGGKMFNQLTDVLNEIMNEGRKVEILFLDCKAEVLLKRYKETRRNHPLLAKGERIAQGIMRERELLWDIKNKADYIIDTSHLLTRELRSQLGELILDNKNFESLMISVISFGFKYGIPTDCDLVFDVRFIPNPFYIDELKALTGNDVAVRDYVMKWDESVEFSKKVFDLLQFLIPNYIKEGKNQLVIGIGCTGGKHRSVTLANELYNNLKNASHSVVISHRDIDKDAKK
ncbi:MAG TPA: RNase adapter RapZ [Lachnospiraceae bacterium]|nr:RNase adapter RapZ [Lachnospiraceae bacterium]